jgi:hypothetical protein
MKREAMVDRPDPTIEAEQAMPRLPVRVVREQAKTAIACTSARRSSLNVK